MTVTLLGSHASQNPAEYLIPYFKHKKETPCSLTIQKRPESWTSRRLQQRQLDEQVCRFGNKKSTAPLACSKTEKHADNILFLPASFDRRMIKNGELIRSSNL